MDLDLRDNNYVGSLQFWQYALCSGTIDGAIRMWDRKCVLYLQGYFVLELPGCIPDTSHCCLYNSSIGSGTSYTCWTHWTIDFIAV
jgi:hypothetical protein